MVTQIKDSLVTAAEPLWREGPADASHGYPLVDASPEKEASLAEFLFRITGGLMGSGEVGPGEPHQRQLSVLGRCDDETGGVGSYALTPKRRWQVVCCM